jgi:hypothetical protein
LQEKASVGGIKVDYCSENLGYRVSHRLAPLLPFLRAAGWARAEGNERPGAVLAEVGLSTGRLHFGPKSGAQMDYAVEGCLGLKGATGRPMIRATRCGCLTRTAI